MDNRHEFVLRAKQPGVNFAALCREFNVSRPTGYATLRRFDEQGMAGLEDRARGPSRGSGIKCSAEVALEIVRLRQRKPTWGPKKILLVLARTWPKSELPSTRGFWRILERAGLASSRRTRRRRHGDFAPTHKPEVVVTAPNDLWTVDFKGWWRTRDGKKCEPLTVRDAYSRFVLSIELVGSTRIALVKEIFEQLFRDYGMPKAIQSDNGPPFASTTSLCGLTKLSAWWVALGIEVVRSRVACPQDNGGHERLHLDMAAELERHPAATRAAQQEACDLFREEFNGVRPHEAIGNQTPSAVYRKSGKAYDGAPLQPTYPEHMEVRRVAKCGTVRYAGFQRNLSQALGGYDVGFEYLGEQRFRVWFAELCIGEGTLPWNAPLSPVPASVDEAAA